MTLIIWVYKKINKVIKDFNTFSNENINQLNESVDRLTTGFVFKRFFNKMKNSDFEYMIYIGRDYHFVYGYSLNRNKIVGFVNERGEYIYPSHDAKNSLSLKEFFYKNPLLYISNFDFMNSVNEKLKSKNSNFKSVTNISNKINKISNILKELDKDKELRQIVDIAQLGI